MEYLSSTKPSRIDNVFLTSTGTETGTPLRISWVNFDEMKKICVMSRAASGKQLWQFGPIALTKQFSIELQVLDCSSDLIEKLNQITQPLSAILIQAYNRHDGTNYEKEWRIQKILNFEIIERNKTELNIHFQGYLG